MPLNILTPLAAVGALPDVDITGTGFFFGVDVEAIPNVDAMGGSLAVSATTAATETSPATVTVEYTAADSTTTSATFDLPEGYSVDATEGVVFGAALDGFLLAGTRVGVTEGGESGQAVTMLEVGIGADGVPVSFGFNNSLRPELFEDSRDVVESLELYPLGDGRVGYDLPATRDDWGIQHGVIADGTDGFEVTDLGGGVLVDGRVIALDDGGFLYVEQGPGNSSPVVQQFDAGGTLLAEQPLSLDLLGAADDTLGTLTDLTLLVNDSGELDVFATTTDGLYKVELDLLPQAEAPTDPLDLKVLGFEGVDLLDVPVFESTDGGYNYETEGTDVRDDAGGRMIGGVAPDSTATLTYIDADGVQTIAQDVLPEGAEFSQGTAIPLGDEQAFLIAYETENPDTFGADAKLALVTLGPDGTPVLSDLPDDLLPFDPSDQQYDIELSAMSDGRVAVLSSYDDGEGHYSTNAGVISGPSSAPVYTLLIEGPFEGELDGSILALPDGGAVFIGNISDQGGFDDIAIQQFDADGALVAEDVLTAEQMNGLGVDSSEANVVFELTEDGELAAYLTEFGDADAVRVLYDLVPVQSDAPGVELPEIPEGLYFEGEDDGSTFTGTAGSDYFSMADGDDVVRGGAGFDYMSLEGGNDRAFGGDGEDYLDGGDGDDVLYAGNGDDAAYGGDGVDDVRGADGNDFISGGAGDDFLRGNHEDDEMSGGDGADNMNGGFGNDTVSGNAGDDKVSGFDGDDMLFGGNGADALHGGRGADMLDGGAGDDVLRGADGADTLTGGAGDDLLIGGEGADVFSYSLNAPQAVDLIDLDDEGPGGEELFIEDPSLLDNGTDTIKDFTIGEDKIALDGSYLVVDPEDPLATAQASDLTFEDIFLSQEDSVAVIQAGDTTIRLKGVNVDDLSEDDFLLT